MFLKYYDLFMRHMSIINKIKKKKAVAVDMLTGMALL